MCANFTGELERASDSTGLRREDRASPIDPAHMRSLAAALRQLRHARHTSPVCVQYARREGIPFLHGFGAAFNMVQEFGYKNISTQLKEARLQCSLGTVPGRRRTSHPFRYGHDGRG